MPSGITNLQTARLLLKFSIPALSEINILDQQAQAASNAGYLSFVYPIDSDGNMLKLPLWVFGYWQQVHVIASMQGRWRSAIKWFQKQGMNDALKALTRLPWKYNLSFGDVSDLASFASEDWLTSSHVSQISLVIEDELKANHVTNMVVLNQNVIDKLISVFRYSRDAYLTEKSCFHLHDIGNKLTEGEYTNIAFQLSVHLDQGFAVLPTGEELMGNHWVAVVVNVGTGLIMYGDSCDVALPQELVNMIEWWMGNHITQTFVTSTLPCSKEIDGFLCALLSANALTRYFCPGLNLGDCDGLCEREKRFMQIVDLIQKTDFKLAISKTRQPPPAEPRADPMYTPASRRKIEDDQIFSEVAAVRIKQIETLKKEMNLTISYDGGTA
ncbi:hypothetical protein C0992_009522 [Termitomyces sp. T32_za158]|nr:hypothetical protein C0992_009522 [Termitomyces sp. T32_za158]